jgi:hypothetical protein
MVVARLRSQAASSWFLQIRYAPFNTNDRAAPYMLPETPFSTNVIGLTVFDYTEIPLGVVDIPDDASTFTLDLFARQEAGGSTTLRVDFLVLVPIEQASVLSVRQQGAVMALGSSTTVLGAGGGSSVSGTDRLLTVGETGARFAFTPHQGRFRVTWRYSLESPLLADVFRFSTAISGGGATQFSTDVTNVVTDRHDVTVAGEFNATGTNQYDFDAAYQTEASGSAAVFTLHSVSVEYIPAIATGESFRTLPAIDRVFKHDSVGNKTVIVNNAGRVPLWLDPGDNLVYVAPLDIRGQGLSPYLTSVLGRTLDVSWSYAPREL